jgi:peroxiredoxin
LRLLLALFAFPLAALAGERSMPMPGDVVPAFSAVDATGVAVSTEGAQAIVVAFSAKGCPIASAQAPLLAELSTEFASRGARFVLVNSNAQEDKAEFAAFAKEAGVEFPVVMDPIQRLADHFGITRSGEVVLLDAGRRVRYRGAVDDQFGLGTKKPAPQREFLREALDAVLLGREPATNTTTAAGCLIARASEKKTLSEAVAYHRDVAPILRKNCVECHRPGEVGPFPLLDYRDADGWSLMIREVVEAGLMPPWHADPRYGNWENARALSEKEKKTILDWVDAGSPEGPVVASDPIPPSDPGRWHIGTPDLVIQAPKQSVPARGEIDYRYAQVDLPLTEDRWVSAAEIHAGARSIVHHILVFVRYPKDRQSEQPPIDGGLEAGYFACLVPGERPNVWPAGTAKLLPKGGKLIFQIHYTANGTPQEDVSEIGLVFSKDLSTPRRVVTTRGINHQAIRIPPGEPNATFTTFWKPPKDVTFLSFMPHMHFRGKSFRYEAEYPDGRKEILLDVPRYDFNWQATYRFKEPLSIPAGTKIRVTASYDNSPGNPANPDPTKLVRWGDQTWDEMLIGYVDYVEN